MYIDKIVTVHEVTEIDVKKLKEGSQVSSILFKVMGPSMQVLQLLHDDM